jgi:hypothetical protein
MKMAEAIAKYTHSSTIIRFSNSVLKVFTKYIDMSKHRDHLLKKMVRKASWSDEDLSYAHKTMGESHKHKSRAHLFLDSTLIWILFIVILGGNLLVLYSIVPLIVAFPNYLMYLFVIVLGFFFGYLYEIILRDVEHSFSLHHHYILNIALPALCAYGGFVIYSITMDALPNIFGVVQYPLKVSIFYALSFMIPYFVLKMVGRE